MSQAQRPQLIICGTCYGGTFYIVKAEISNFSVVSYTLACTLCATRRDIRIDFLREGSTENARTNEENPVPRL